MALCQAPGTTGRPDDPDGTFAQVGARLVWDFFWRIRKLTEPK